MQRPEIDEHRRRDAEAQEIGERIQLCAQVGGDLEKARRATVQGVGHPRQDDQDDGELEALIEPIANRRQAADDADHGEDVGHLMDQRLGAQPPPSTSRHQLRLQPAGP